jgi:Periplasmic protein involved in polysaccharide export
MASLDQALQKSDEGTTTGAYVVTRLDVRALNLISSHFASWPEGRLVSVFGGRHILYIGVGDSLIVNIWEASADGLFSTTERKQVSLNVNVDESGMIFIPYAGQIKAGGKRVEELRRAIEKALDGKAAHPQVQVLMQENSSNSVVVMGDAAKPGQYTIPTRGMRLMEAIARAGGTREATFETVVYITRGKTTGEMRLDSIVNFPENDIWLAPRDKIQLLHKPRTYSAFGAVKSSQLVPFKTENLTLTEAMAQVGGLRDGAADSGGVFIFRFEDTKLVRQLVPDQQSGLLAADAPAQIPIIYRLDFTDPEAFFIATSFKMREKDVLYVANHPAAEFSKFLNSIVSPIVGTARSGVALATTD